MVLNMDREGWPHNSPACMEILAVLIDVPPREIDSRDPAHGAAVKGWIPTVLAELDCADIVGSGDTSLLNIAKLVSAKSEAPELDIIGAIAWIQEAQRKLRAAGQLQPAADEAKYQPDPTDVQILEAVSAERGGLGGFELQSVVLMNRNTQSKRLKRLEKAGLLTAKKRECVQMTDAGRTHLASAH